MFHLCFGFNSVQKLILFSHVKQRHCFQDTEEKKTNPEVFKGRFN